VKDVKNTFILLKIIARNMALSLIIASEGKLRECTLVAAECHMRPHDNRKFGT